MSRSTSGATNRRMLSAIAATMVLLLTTLLAGSPAGARGTPPSEASSDEDCPDPITGGTDINRLLGGTVDPDADPADPDCPEGGPGVTVANDDSVSTTIRVDMGSFPVLPNDSASESVAGIDVLSNGLPIGLTFWDSGSAEGTITGTPQECGTFQATYRLNSTSGSTDTATVTVDVDCPGTVAVDDTIYGRVGTELAPPTGHPLNDVTINDRASLLVDRVDAVVLSIPNGTTLWPNGEVTGTPTECGSFDSTYRLVSTSGSTDTATLRLIISCPGDPVDTVAVDDSVTGERGEPLADLRLTANDSPSIDVARIDFVSGTVPDGLTVWESGWLNGTPQVTGVFSFVYRLTSTSGSTDTATVTVTITEPSSIPPPIDPPDDCEAQFRDDPEPDRGVEVHDADDAGWAPVYNFYNADRQLVTSTASLTESLSERQAPDDRWRFDTDMAAYYDPDGPFGNYLYYEREWQAGLNPGFEPGDIYYVSAVDDSGAESDLHGCNHTDACPVGLDLDGSGSVERITGRFHFDIDGDGDLDLLGEWFAPTEGILVAPGASARLDGRHLFGDLGGTWADGYEKLSGRDIDGDGRVDGDELAGLAVWIDADSDARLDDGELSTLDANGVTSIRTAHTDFVSSADLADGGSMVTEDLWFPVLDGGAGHTAGRSDKVDAG